MSKHSVVVACSTAALAGLAAASLLHIRKWRSRRQREHWHWNLVRQAAAKFRAKGLEVLGPEAEEEAVELARSFSALPTYDWSFGPAAHGCKTHPFRLAGARYTVRLLFRKMHAQGGLAVGVRASGRLIAMCLVCPFIAEDGTRGSFLPIAFEKPPWPLENKERYGELPMRRQLWFSRGDAPLLDMLHDFAAPGPHWYINLLVVDERAQGQGHAKRLLGAVHDLADEQQVPCYVETIGQQLKTMYEHLGYTTMSGRGFELNIPGDPAPIRDPDLGSGFLRAYAMVRENRLTS